MKRYKQHIIIALICLGIGYMISYYSNQQKEIFQKQQSTLVLEKIKKVFKVIAVEGQISEIFDHKEYWAYDVFPFQKKMLVRALGNVSVGYDIDSLNFEMDSKTQSIKIGPFPEAEVISLDFDIDYYDVSEGLFNSFSAQDFTKIQQKVKELIREKSESGILYQKAEEQKNTMIHTFQDIVEIYGWKVIVIENDILD